MKILYVTTISNTVNAFLIPHIKMLINQGHQVDIAFNIVQEVSPELKKLGCEIYDIEFQRSPLKKDNYTAFKKLKRLILREEYDIVHTHTPVASFITRLACRKIQGIKIIYTAHGFHFFKGAPLKNWLIFYPMEWLAAKWTDCLITMNEEDYLSGQKMMRNKKMVLKVPGVGVDLKKFSPHKIEVRNQLRSKYGYKNDEFILVYAGELSFRKHQDLLIDSIYHIKKKIPEVKLLLVGNGPLLEKYEHQVEKLGLNDCVEFLGFRNDINKIMTLSDIAVSSSRHEGLPVNIMEAMATGLPIIATGCRGNIDLVEDGENGFIVEDNDIKGFSNAVEELYLSGKLMNKFSVNSSVKVKEFTINNVLKEMQRIYLSLF
ncbi:glycosyltransferase family 4 protein [Halobacillus aidingensis]|uniref:Glycosyltransferase EpsD n=1 Tax=Halobacillus aidingensis TaxID=240303 RepID=A0A1H0KJP2_HALAD|nr:glycosyltransferase family 4 protein [Halobacillus aidingensis]SDO56167.1 glycosyltransferase EpsD [Halobacillus aidingensis]